MVKSQTGKGNENRGESFITFKERKFGEGDNHPKKFRKIYEEGMREKKQDNIKGGRYDGGHRGRSCDALDFASIIWVEM